MMVGAAVPVIERFEFITAEIELYGENAPDQSGTCARGCTRTDTGFLIPSLDIQTMSSCDFLVDSLSLSVKDKLYVTTDRNTRNFSTRFEWDRTWCFFAEEFGGNDMWIRQEETFWLPPGDYSLRIRGVNAQDLDSRTSAKLVLILGDEGQSEDFSGTPVDVGECSAPSADFYENECANYVRWGTFLLRVAVKPVVYLLSLVTGNADFIYGILGVTQCEPSTAPPLPHLTDCRSDKDYSTLCNQACHNHEVCSGDTNCTFDSWGEGLCSETCAYRLCPGQKGPLPEHQCRDTDPYPEYWKTKHVKPDECPPTNNFDH
jgi:hypothetical protein